MSWTRRISDAREALPNDRASWKTDPRIDYGLSTLPLYPKGEPTPSQKSQPILQ
jgi:hypothetical protein